MIGRVTIPHFIANQLFFSPSVCFCQTYADICVPFSSIETFKLLIPWPEFVI